MELTASLFPGQLWDQFENIYACPDPTFTSIQESLAVVYIVHYFLDVGNCERCFDNINGDSVMIQCVYITARCARYGLYCVYKCCSKLLAWLWEKFKSCIHASKNQLQHYYRHAQNVFAHNKSDHNTH